LVETDYAEWTEETGWLAGVSEKTSEGFSAAFAACGVIG